MSERIRIPKEKHQIIQLRKKYKSYNEDNKSPKHYSNRLIINLVDNNNNIDINYEREKKEFKNSYDFEEIYKNIKNSLENFIEKNSKNNELLFSILNKIYSFIDSLLSRLTTNIEEIKDNQSLIINENNSLDSKSKEKYELKMDELNKKIKNLNNEIELKNMNEESKKTYINFRSTEPNHSLKKKILQLESKIKLNEFKYLLYIKEQQNKIKDLEKQLKLKKISESEEMKEIKCFPYLIHYNFKEDINPKSIPLTKSILKEFSNNTTNIQNKSQKDSFLTLTNSNSKIKKNNKIVNTKKNYLKSNHSTVKNYTINNETSGDELGLNPKKKIDHRIIKLVDFSNQNNLDDDIINNNLVNISSKTKRLYRCEDKNNIKIIKDSNNNDNILNKEKKYFISHPNLLIAGIDGKKSKFSKGLPNKIFSFKFSKNLQKDLFFKFPSTLKETLVNLQKLRINKDYLDSDDII